MFNKGRRESDCAAFESKFIEYLGASVRPADRHSVEEHLSGCPACRSRAEEFRALWGALDELPAISPSPSFDASLRARLTEQPSRHGFREWMPSPRLVFAMTALVAVSVWLSSMPRVHTTPPLGSQVSPVIPANQVSQVTTESDFGMIRDLPVLENFDVVSKFDALSELPVLPAVRAPEARKEAR